MVTPDRATAHDLGPTRSSVVLRDLAMQNVTFECIRELVNIEEEGNRNKVTLRHVLTDATEVRNVDFVVVEQRCTMQCVSVRISDSRSPNANVANGGKEEHAAG